MKFGVREICDVVLRAKATQKVGNKTFYKHEPVIYFDTLKTSSMEGAATSVYAQGGRGNARLVAWEGERTVTFTMEDALISPEGFMILSGAGLIEASPENTIKQHITETFDATDELHVNKAEREFYLSHKPYMGIKNGAASGNYCYVMFVKDGEIISEPYIPEHVEENAIELQNGLWTVKVKSHGMYEAKIKREDSHPGTYTVDKMHVNGFVLSGDDGSEDDYDSVIVDYYTERKAGTRQIEITADKFGGNYYLEASTLFRDQNGTDMPAEFIIPNCKIQSNFTFTMASSGDPSTFTFTMDAFPDYTRFDRSKKVFAAIQIIEEAAEEEYHRHSTYHRDLTDSEKKTLGI